MPKTPKAAAWVQANNNRAANRSKPKSLPAVSLEQRAAPLKAAVGLARDERLRLAREDCASEQGDTVDSEIAARLEEELLHQQA